ncbi:AfsR/SARP family transcriptional regulator [Nostocoides japonicum]|uniref:AfsR/SARP family transcriptional regulator n=1 Tax=Nostocoides japonicum TaxID=99481 RepID=UPI00065B9F92|nr:BTAD domain-containing putative transcriptional regulator [Tetrasphaera japonica]
MIFRDLGRLRVEADDIEVPLPGRRLASVLARLVASVGETVPVDALIEAIWGEQPPARSAQALETVVWRLRSVLEPDRAAGEAATVVRRLPAGYRLAVPPDAVDSHRFTALAERADEALDAGDAQLALELSETALSLWRGEPYDSLTDAAWLAPTRQRLAECRAALATLHVQALLDTGHPERALSAVVPLLAEHPFRERLWAQRILGLYRTGRQADALSAYAEAQRVLSEELGIDPGPELRSLQAQILHHAAELDPPIAAAPAAQRLVPVRLPSRRGPLIGREEVVADIVRRSRSHRLVTVTGAGGAGKTRVAVEAAHHLVADHPDGVWFIDLTELRPEDGDATRLREIIAATLDLAPRPQTPVARLIADQLRDRRLLLLVDNCEQVLDAVSPVLDEILDASSAVRVLATSREALEVGDEMVVGLAPLSRDEATALFAERLATHRPDLDPFGSDRAEVERICAAVGGLPLGIELAAARVRVFELSEVAATLAGGVAELSRSGRGPQRHASMLETVDWSYRLARPDERVLHRRLATLSGPVTAEAAGVLCSVSPLTPDDAPGLLAGLVHRSLLMPARPGGSAGVTTFRQLVPTRAHADRLLEDDERGAVTAARDRWVIDAIRQAPLTGSSGQAEASAWLRDNSTAVSATLTSVLVDSPQPAALELLSRLMLHWFERGQLLEAAHWYRSAVAAAEAGAFCGVEAALARVLELSFRGLGQDRAAAARIVAELPALLDPPAASAALAGEVLVLVAVSTWVAQAAEVGAPAATAAMAIGERIGRADITVRARALLDMHRLGAPDRKSALADAREILAEPHDNEFAAFVASYACAMAALADGDPEAGLEWMRRTALAHRVLAMHPTSELLEDVARILASTDGSLEAVRCYAAAQAMHSRDGLPWPRLPHSASVIRSLRDRLPDDVYDRLWRSGERLGISRDPVTLLDEWLPAGGPSGTSGAAASSA